MNNEKILELYKTIYCLPEFIYKENVGAGFFKSCRKNSHFLILVVYNEKKEILIMQDKNKEIGWELPGGYLMYDEQINESVKRIVAREINIEIAEYRPCAFLKNIFLCNGQKVIHRGIAFLIFSKSPLNDETTGRKFSYVKNFPQEMAYQNKNIALLGQRIIQRIASTFPDKEISKRPSPLLLSFHKLIVKRLGKLSSLKIKKEIFSIIKDKPKRLVDISCGDDNLIFELSKFYHTRLSVANDICWEIFSNDQNTGDCKSEILFTKHNILDLPFKIKFDLMIFKNTLHHVSFDEQISLIKKLSHNSKQLIIVDIENPSCQNLLSKLWHWYYVFLLKDQGRCFLTFREFQNLINHAIKDKQVNFGIIKTIKGRYFYANIFE